MCAHPLPLFLCARGNNAIMIVTAYYDLYGRPARFWEYFDLFYEVAASGLSIVLFTSPDLIRRFRFLPPTVHLVSLPLEDCELYSMAMAYCGELPSGRTPEKDTREFFALMNTKIEFVKRARAMYPTKTGHAWMWLDYGIMKIMKRPEDVLEKLRALESTVVPPKNMLLPGCWGMGQHAFRVDQINWRFCGGFFVIPDDFVDRFYDHSRCVLRDFCTQSQYKLTWETNVWAIIEACAEDRDRMQWYAADHDDRMILLCPSEKIEDAAHATASS